MKKLIFAAAIASISMLASAISCQWGSGDLYFGGAHSQVKDTSGTALDGTGDVMGYLFTGLTYADYAKLTSAQTIWSSFDAANSKLTVAGGGTYTGEATASKWGTVDWSDTEGAQGVPEYAAVVLLYSQGEDDYYSANTLYGTPGQMGLVETTVALGWGENATGAATTWETVPEPFSGTLALLGMLGIGLRRKLKKAKKA